MTTIIAMSLIGYGMCRAAWGAGRNRGPVIGHGSLVVAGGLALARLGGGGND